MAIYNPKYVITKPRNYKSGLNELFLHNWVCHRTRWSSFFI